MEKLFQTQWHNIKFSSFAELSESRIADAEFYKKYYEKFFIKYKKWDDLEPEWVRLKVNIAKHLRESPDVRTNQKVLSIGCGIGIIEKELICSGFDKLEIMELSGDILKWMAPLMPKERIHIGLFPDCLPPNSKYDLIFLGGIEYCFDQHQLIKLLKDVNRSLEKGGRVILISHSYYDTNRPLIDNLKSNIKNIVMSILDNLLFRKSHKRQFWGYLRDRSDFFDAMKYAGFKKINDELINTETKWGTYCVKGER